MINNVTIYKVILNTPFIWPGKVSLYNAFFKESAKAFIDDYPNTFLKPFLKIEEEVIPCYETD